MWDIQDDLSATRQIGFNRRDKRTTVHVHMVRTLMSQRHEVLLSRTSIRGESCDVLYISPPDRPGPRRVSTLGVLLAHSNSLHVLITSS